MTLTKHEAWAGGSFLALAFGWAGENLNAQVGLAGLTALVAASVAYGITSCPTRRNRRQ